MKEAYESPKVEIVNLSENDVLLFSNSGVVGGQLDEIIFSDLFT